MSGHNFRTKEFYDLIRCIGETRSKQEEDRIIGREITKLKNHFRLGVGMSPQKKKELIVRLLYCELLGHDASFGYIEAIKLTSSKNMLFRRTGYLAVTLLLPKDHELVLLTVANIQKDLNSTNQLQVNAALTVASKLITPETIPSISPGVKMLLDKPFPLVRKKAICYFRAAYNVDPEATPDILEICKSGLSDKNPSVMGVSLDLYYDLILRNPHDPHLRSLCDCFVQVLDQILDRQLSSDYLYRRVSAPWIQIKILRIFAQLGKNDKPLSKKIYPVIKKCLKKNDVGLTIGFAVVYECIKTITSIYAQQSLIEIGLSSINRLLSSTNNNLKYIGIYCLKKITKLEPRYASHYFSDMMECLDDDDESLRKVTLSLLCQFTNSRNITVIVPKLFSYVRKTINEVERKNLIQKILELSEQHAPNMKVYIDNIKMMLEYVPEAVPFHMFNTLVKMIREEQESDEQTMNEKILPQCMDEFAEILQEKGDTLHENYVKIICWFIGEYHSYSKKFEKSEILDLFCDTIDMPMRKNNRAFVLFSLLKLFKGNNNDEAISTDSVDEIIATIEKYKASVDVQTQEIAFELESILKMDERESLVKNFFSASASITTTRATSRMNSLLGGVDDGPRGGETATETFEQLEMDPDLMFLDEFVEEAMNNGAPIYHPPDENEIMFLDEGKGELKRIHEKIVHKKDSAMIIGKGLLKDEEEGESLIDTSDPEKSLYVEGGEEEIPEDRIMVEDNVEGGQGVWGEYLENEEFQAGTEDDQLEDQYSNFHYNMDEEHNGHRNDNYNGDDDYEGNYKGIRINGIGSDDFSHKNHVLMDRSSKEDEEIERKYLQKKKKEKKKKRKKGKKKTREFVGQLLSSSIIDENQGIQRSSPMKKEPKQTKVEQNQNREKELISFF